jgi:hypothetical protein
MSHRDREDPRSAGGDSALDRAWQQASDEQPTPQLDAAILAAARKSVQEGARRDPLVRARARSWNWLARWQPLAAAAAVAGLAFVLVQSLPREPTVAPPLRVEPSAPAPATTQEKAPGPVKGDARNPATAEATDLVGAQGSVVTEVDESAKVGLSAADSTASAVSARAPGPTPATINEYDMEAGADRADALRRMDAGQRNLATSKRATGVAAPEVAAAAASESMHADAAPPSTAERSAHIAALFAAGDVSGAADALRAFRAADPQADTYLPESLREWARTVR